MEKYVLHVFGSRGTRPVTGRNYGIFGGATSCYILKSDDHAIILDCGTGLYDAEDFLQDVSQIDILLTHFHYDHILGLLDIGVFPKDAKIRLFSRKGGFTKTYQPGDFLKEPFWPISPMVGKTILVNVGEKVQLSERASAMFSASNHPNEASMIRVDTDDGSMCLICDYEHGEPFPLSFGKDCRYMIYDGTFTPEEYPERVGWGHSTWVEGIKLCRRLEIPKLYITHHDPKRTDAQLLNMESEAQKIFPATRFLRAGDVCNFD